MTTRASFYLDDDVIAALHAEGGPKGMSARANAILRKGLGLDDPDPQRTMATVIKALGDNPDATLGKVWALAQRHGPEVGLQALLLAAGAKLNVMDNKEREAMP